MKLQLLGYTISISRQNSSSGPFTLDDVRQINDDRVEQLRALSHAELQSRIDEITVSGINSNNGLEQARSVLRKYGIVVIPNFLAPETAEHFAQSLDSTYQQNLAAMSGDYKENEHALIQKGAVRVSGYRNLASYPKPIIQVRQGQDQGMVDIFNADQLTPELASHVREPFQRDSILSLIQSSGSKLEPQNLNCYINHSITSTRGFHVDSYSEQLKGFIYLTDVSSLDDGPYTYVKGSHLNSPYRRANQVLSANLPNNTEAPLLNQEAVTPIIASKGALVISDQGGFHRGFPQRENGHRMIAVMNYK